jgi:hypothetical protein
MNLRGPYFRWKLFIPALVLGAWLLGAMFVGRRGQVNARGWLDGQHGRLHTRLRPRLTDATASPAQPQRLDDPRLSVLRSSADSWRKALTSRRKVIDQVCLVPDVRSFLEAIAFWDDRHFFPILIDEPAWTLPFLRSFRPARIVRYTQRADAKSGPSTDGPKSDSTREGRWSQALEAVALACSDRPDVELQRTDGAALNELSPAAPGAVLSAPDSPMLAGAVALAAGHFQPLVRFDPVKPPSSDRAKPTGQARFHDVLSQPAAWDFARLVESRVAAAVATYDQMGDRCDFLTLAGDWPYRYSLGEETSPSRGVFALDDLIGRKLEGGPNPNGLAQCRKRWAYVGRLLGDPAASVARAMAALFLPPRSALLWNTYRGGDPWSNYDMVAAAARLERVLPRSSAITHRAGSLADLSRWHQSVDPANRYGLVLFNSSGGPDHFAISGGPGRPADIPRGIPTAVAMIHSFSAVDPTDPQTIAGRWLDQGAFVYFGSVWEPLLAAFRTPRLVAELAAAGIPLSAALRQGELEPFGLPWRLVYLGDPLYRIQAPASERMTPKDWPEAAPRVGDWPFLEIDQLIVGSIPPATQGENDSDVERLNWCLDAAIVGSVKHGSDPTTARSGNALKRTSSPDITTGWRMVLRSVRRDRLDRQKRAHYDEILIDALSEIGDWDELQRRLEQIPPLEAQPRVWETIEACAFNRLARLARDPDESQEFVKSLNLWDEVMCLAWPDGSKFPAQITERVSALVQADRFRRLETWLDRLRRTGDSLAGSTARQSQVATIAAERQRAQAQLGNR